MREEQAWGAEACKKQGSGNDPNKGVSPFRAEGSPRHEPPSVSADAGDESLSDYEQNALLHLSPRALQAQNPVPCEVKRVSSTLLGPCRVE